MSRNLLLLVCSFGVAAVLLEAVLRLLFPIPPTWHEPQTRHLGSPLLGWVLPPNSRSFTIDAPVSVNSHGLRDDEFPIAKPHGELRVLSLGDSFTFALGVRFEDLYVQQLERRLNELHAPHPVQVINTGVAGYNTRHELIYLLAEGLRFEPDLVTVGFYWNDLIGNEPALPDIASTPKLLPDARLKEKRERWLPAWIRNPLRRSLLAYQSVIRTKALAAALQGRPPSLLEQLQRALLEGDEGAVTPYWKHAAERLLAIYRAAADAGVPTLLLAFPMELQVLSDDPSPLYARELARIWEPTGMPFIDLEPGFRRALDAGENPFLPYDLHPNAAGMRIAADALYSAIEEHGLLAIPSGHGVQTR